MNAPLRYLLPLLLAASSTPAAAQEARATPDTRLAQADEAVATATPGWLGIVLDGDDPTAGALVERLAPGSPAGAAGVERGMRILAVDGTPVSDVDELIALIGSQAAGTTVTLTIDGHAETIDVVLGERSGDPSSFAHSLVGEHLPDVNVVDARTGEPTPLWEPGHGATVVEFWATWCGPCRASLPSMRELHASLGDQARIISVTSESAAELGDFHDRENMAWQIARDDDHAANDALWVMSLPTWVVADADGTIVAVFTGGGSTSELDAVTRTLVGASAGAGEGAD